MNLLRMKHPFHFTRRITLMTEEEEHALEKPQNMELLCFLSHSELLLESNTETLATKLVLHFFRSMQIF
jgi:hypothetical protein